LFTVRAEFAEGPHELFAGEAAVFPLTGPSQQRLHHGAGGFRSLVQRDFSVLVAVDPRECFFGIPHPTSPLRTGPASLHHACDVVTRQCVFAEALHERRQSLAEFRRNFVPGQLAVAVLVEASEHLSRFWPTGSHRASKLFHGELVFSGPLEGLAEPLPQRFGDLLAADLAVTVAIQRFKPLPQFISFATCVRGRPFFGPACFDEFVAGQNPVVVSVSLTHQPFEESALIFGDLVRGNLAIGILVEPLEDGSGLRGPLLATDSILTNRRDGNHDPTRPGDSLHRGTFQRMQGENPEK